MRVSWYLTLNIFAIFVIFQFLDINIHVDAWGRHDWNRHGKWRPLKNRMCPSHDPESHECYDMTTENSTCLIHRFSSCEYNVGDSYCTMYFTTEKVPCTIYQCTHRGCCEGWTEDLYGDCSIPLPSSQTLQCENGGTLMESTNTCDCPEHFTGTKCETVICPSECLNGGRCEMDGVSPKCICPSKAYTGDQCQEVTCATTCQHGGQCIQDGVLTRCQCTSDYQGDSCQYEMKQSCPMFSGINDVDTCTGQRDNECETDVDCNHDGDVDTRVCCFDGCNGVCKRKQQIQPKCMYKDTEYNAGESFRSHTENNAGESVRSHCESCVCQSWGEVQCAEMECPEIRCGYGQQQEYKEDHCCKVCTGMNAGPDLDMPKFTNCPTRFITANVQKGTATAKLPENDLRLTARDYYGNNLKVTFSRTEFAHSRSSDIHTNIHVVTAFSRCDRYGRRAECVFKLIVKDPYPPEFTLCPAEIYALDDETITWSDPIYEDNVGNLRIKAQGDEIKDTQLAVGTYSVSYTVWDYDQNQAICAFLVRVFDQSMHTMPSNLMRRDNDIGINIGKLIGIAVGSLVSLVFALCLLARLKSRNIENTPPDMTDTPTPNNIYSICGPPALMNNPTYANDVKLPAYAPPTNPPSYDDIGYCSPIWPPPNSNLDPPIYEELPNKPKTTPHYENITDGQTNPTYENDEKSDEKIKNEMEYMKI